ncbi:MAG: GTPase HflX [Chloroflexota bacterium]
MRYSKKLIDTKLGKEQAILVGVDIPGQKQMLTLEASLTELELLASTAGVKVTGIISQKMDRPNPKTFIGAGKVEEVKILAEEVLANLVIFDDELSPRHQRELEEAFGEKIKVMDRTALILDIFAQHASTREGILQVELAQYEYRLPRLTKAWTHLARQAGGGGGRSGAVGGVGLRGPGERQLEVDRREIRTRIAKLKAELQKVREHRMRYRSRRKKTQIPVIALVGYTNAGKSTLLNQLSGADVYVADQLFATLDPITRRVELQNGQSVLITDTVGFIQKLPTQLVAAFRATLEEIAEADLLLHVVDVTHQNAPAQAKSVLQTLEEIEAGDIPVITALNKIDYLKNPGGAIARMADFPNTYAISALTKSGLPELVTAIATELFENYLLIKVRLPYQEGKLISVFHEQGHVEQMTHGRGGVIMHGMLPKRLYTRFQPFTDYLEIEEED